MLPSVVVTTPRNYASRPPRNFFFNAAYKSERATEGDDDRVLHCCAPTKTLLGYDGEVRCSTAARYGTFRQLSCKRLSSLSPAVRCATAFDPHAKCRRHSRMGALEWKVTKGDKRQGRYELFFVIVFVLFIQYRSVMELVYFRNGKTTYFRLRYRIRIIIVFVLRMRVWRKVMLKLSSFFAFSSVSILTKAYKSIGFVL